jgi:hypothetical protein
MLIIKVDVRIKFIPRNHVERKYITVFQNEIVPEPLKEGGSVDTIHDPSKSVCELSETQIGSLNEPDYCYLKHLSVNLKRRKTYSTYYQFNCVIIVGIIFEIYPCLQIHNRRQTAAN